MVSSLGLFALSDPLLDEKIFCFVNRREALGLGVRHRCAERHQQRDHAIYLFSGRSFRGYTPSIASTLATTFDIIQPITGSPL